MTLRVRDIGTTRRAIRAQVRTTLGPAPIARMWFRTPTALVRFFNRAMSVSVNPMFASGFGSGNRPVTTNSVQASASNGTPPYSFSWAGDNGIFPQSPNSATTSFIGSPPAGETIDGTCTCTITDASGLSAAVSVNVTLSRG